MAGVGIDDYGASFIHYLPKYVKTYNDVDVIRNIPLGKIKWEGEKVVKKVQVKRNTSMTYTTDGGHIPAPKKNTYVESEGTRKFFVGSVGVTDGILNNAKTTRNAAVRVTDSELRGLMSGMRTAINFFFPRDGTGVVGLLGSVTNTSAAYATTPITMDDARGMWDDGDYEIRDATTPTTIHGTIECSRVPRARSSGESQVYLKADLGALGQARYDYVTWKSGVDASYGRALTGLDALINDSGTFQGVNVSNYPRYTSIVMDGGGSAQNLTPPLCRTMLATLAQERAERTVSKLLVYTSVWDAKNFEEMFQGELRIAPSTRVGGAKIPTFQSVFGTFSVLTDPHAPYGKMYFIDRSQISWLKQKELGWRQTGGPSGIFTTQQGYLGYVASALCIDDLFIEDRRRCGKITNLNVTVQSAY